MNQQNTVESRVLSILKDCPRARFDDMILVMHYYNRYATYLRAGELPLNDLAFNYKVYGLPCFETIRKMCIRDSYLTIRNKLSPDLSLSL